jgi:hypothetical protein
MRNIFKAALRVMITLYLINRYLEFIERMFGKKEETRDRPVINYRSYLQNDYGKKTKTTSASDHASEFYKIQNDGYIIQTRRRANEIVNYMTELITSSGFVTEGYFKTLLGVKLTSRDLRYGWIGLVQVSIDEKEDGGFIINLPKPKLLGELASDLVSEVAKPDKDRPYNNILVKDLKVAEKVRRDIYNLLDTRGKVTMENVYDLLGVQTCEADTKYGWTKKDLDQINIIPGEWGFHISLPKAKLLLA